jgi:hypothetical protein
MKVVDKGRLLDLEELLGAYCYSSVRRIACHSAANTSTFEL